MHYSTDNSQNVILTVSASKTGSTDFAELTNSRLTAFPGYSVLNFDTITVGNRTNNYDRLRLTFTSSGSNKVRGLLLQGLGLYGGVGWSAPGNLAKIGTIYSFDEYGNVKFPATIKSTEIVNFDANIKPTQTGTVAKTSDWLWQYYAQSIAWLMANHLPLAGGRLTGVLDVGSAGFKMHTGTGWTSKDRAIPFSSDADLDTMKWYNTDANTGLTYNPESGALKAGSFVKRGGTATQALMADGSTKDISGFASPDDIPVKLPNPQNLIIQVLDDTGAALGTSISYNGSEVNTLILASGDGISLTDNESPIGQAVAINLKQIAGTTLLGNVNGTTGTPQAITMAQLRTMLGSLTLNGISVTLGGNNSYTLPCYIDYNGTRYQCRISNDATGLQIYSNGAWTTIGRFATISTRGNITNSNISSWWSKGISTYIADTDASALLLNSDVAGQGFGVPMSKQWSGQAVKINLTAVQVSDPTTEWKNLKTNIKSCYPEGMEVQVVKNQALDKGWTVVRLEMSFDNSTGLAVCVVDVYTEDVI